MDPLLKKLNHKPGAAVRQVAVDADWSALRFRQAEHIGQLQRDPTRLLSEQARRRVATRSKAPRPRTPPQPASRPATSSRRSKGWTSATRTWPAPSGP